MILRRQLFLVLIVVGSAAVYLIGNNSVALWDRDEPRYAQTSRQMWQSGDWVVPHYLDNVRTAKPALIYWCQAAAMSVLGDNAFAARLPSAVATVALLILLSIVFWRTIGAERTVWAVFIFATAGLTIAAAKMCITDAVLLLWVTIAQLCLFAILRRNSSWPIILVFAVAHGLALLTKGPVLLGFQAMTLLAMGMLRLADRKFPPAVAMEMGPMDAGNRPAARLVWVKIIVALLIVAAITLPWVVMVNHRASAFIKTAMGHDVWDRMMTPLEQHKGPPGYYLISIWITYFPWSLLLPLTIGLTLRHRANPRIRFAMAAILGPWIMLECIRTKLPHYLLPVFPPLAFLTADALVRCLHGEFQDLKSKGFVIAVGIWCALVAAIASGPWIVVRAFQPLPYAAMTTVSVLGVLFGVVVFASFQRRRVVTGLVAMGAGTMVLVSVIYGWYLPKADFLRISPRVADVLIANGVTHPHEVLMLRYMEPSLAFHQGGTIREAGEVALNDRSVPYFTPWMVVTDEIWEKAPANIRDMFDVVAHVRGLAYADRGTWMDVMIIRRK